MKTTLTLAAMLAATTAHAGGLSDPIVTPPVSIGTPAQASSWSGPYVFAFGGQLNVTTRTEIMGETVTPTYEERPVYDWCKDDGGHGPKTGEKCEGDADHIDRTFGPDLGGHNHYTQTGFMSANRVFLYQEPVTIVDSNGNVLGQGITDGTNPSGTLYRLETGETETVRGPDLRETWVKTLIDEAQASTFGAGIGYRHDFGGLVIGAELASDGDMTTAEVQVGYGLGTILPYAFAGGSMYGDEQGTSYGVGADLRVWERWIIGVGYRVADFDTTSTESGFVRVGFSF